MIKVSRLIETLVITLNVIYVHSVPITQEQLAQYVAAQQTQQAQSPAQQRYVTAAVPRQRQPVVYQQEQVAAAYQDEYLGADDAGAAQYQAEQTGVTGGNQPRTLLYYPQQQQPQLQQPRPVQYKKYAKLRTDDILRSKEQQPEDYDPNPQYQFSFDIKDDESTNYHNRKETRDGDKISGSYSVVDSDGFIRTVTYTADPQEGFKADVNRQPTDIRVKLPKHPEPSLAHQYQQIPTQGLVARKQQTQQYLEASSPIDSVDPQQYAIRPQQAQQVYIQPQPARAASGAYFAAPHRLSPATVSAVAAKAPKAYAPIHQSAAVGAAPLLYRPAYQQ